MLLEKIRWRGFPGQLGRLAIVHGLPLLVDEGVFGVHNEIARATLPAAFIAFSKPLTSSGVHQSSVLAKMRLQRNFHIRRLGRLLRPECRRTRTPAGEFGNFGGADDSDGAAEAKSRSGPDLGAVAAKILHGAAHGPAWWRP